MGMLMNNPVFRALRQWRLQDDAAALGGDVLAHFGQDDELATAVGAGMASPTLRLWRHRHALVLGYRDTRLPAWQEAAAALRDEGYAVGVRTSGGAAVPLNGGVLNLSLIYPTGGLSIEAGFDALYRLVKAALFPLGLEVEQGLVSGSYCPGASDLSHGGRKIAGVAQRRRRLATIVHAFLLVEGRGSRLGALAARFYAQAAAGLQPDAGKRPRYPLVEPAVMRSVSECLGRPVRVVEVAGLLEAALAGLPPSG